YEGRPLLWTVLARDDSGLLLWARDAVAARPFDAVDERLRTADASRGTGEPLRALDANRGSSETLLATDASRGSNDWAASDLRAWLNGQFLDGFPAEERRL